jgi:hypothetical protein
MVTVLTTNNGAQTNKSGSHVFVTSYNELLTAALVFRPSLRLLRQQHPASVILYVLMTSCAVFPWKLRDSGMSVKYEVVSFLYAVLFYPS